jgi:hypothetical protein
MMMMIGINKRYSNYFTFNYSTRWLKKTKQNMSFEYLNFEAKAGTKTRMKRTKNN